MEIIELYEHYNYRYDYYANIERIHVLDICFALYGRGCRGMCKKYVCLIEIK